MAAEDVKPYDLNKIAISFLAVPILGGAGDGDYCTIEKLDPDFTLKVGADGSSARSKTNKEIYKIIISLLQTSPGNAVLSAMRIADKLADNGAGIGTIAIADMGGTSIFGGSKCWISAPPKVNYGAEAGNRDWELTCSDGILFVGGN